MNTVTRSLMGVFIIIVVFLSSCSLYENENEEDEGITYVPIEEIKVDESEETKEVDDSEDDEESNEDETDDEEGVEVTPEDAIVVIVNETELINIQPDAYDPDDDVLDFDYSFPLDQGGSWQTTYGDEGEYTITITASDGEFSVSKDVLIVVNKKEERPSIDALNPDDKTVSLDENSQLIFTLSVSDLNSDPLSYQWKLDGEVISEEESFTYETSFDDSGSHTIKVIVSDGTLEADNLWSVTVKNVNRVPVIEDIEDIRVQETDDVSIRVLVTDPDEDTLSIAISDPVGDDGVWETTYDDAGVYNVIITASDGEDEVSQEVTVTVENVNRPPVIVGITQG
ncbi:hypothetical protein ACFLZX_03300 [Nanoarchaeota archaeon]